MQCNSTTSVHLQASKGGILVNGQHGLGLTALTNRAILLEVVRTAAFVTLHDIAVLVLRISTSSEAFSRGTCSMTFAFSFKKCLLFQDFSLRIIGQEAFAAFAVSFTIASLVKAVASPICSGWSSSVPSPNSLVFAIHEVDGFCSILVRHSSNVGRLDMLVAVVGGGGRR